MNIILQPTITFTAVKPLTASATSCCRENTLGERRLFLIEDWEDHSLISVMAFTTGGDEIMKTL